MMIEANRQTYSLDKMAGLNDYVKISGDAKQLYRVSEFGIRDATVKLTWIDDGVEHRRWVPCDSIEYSTTSMWWHWYNGLSIVPRNRRKFKC